MVTFNFQQNTCLTQNLSLELFLLSDFKISSMKRLLVSVVGILLVFALKAQTNEVGRISGALAAGNANGVSELFLTNVDLTVEANDDLYSKAQASQILRNFFERNQALKFIVNHEGTSRTNDIYKIGTLTTKTGAYRVTFFLKNEGGRYLIKELRIEKGGGF